MCKTIEPHPALIEYWAQLPSGGAKERERYYTGGEAFQSVMNRLPDLSEEDTDMLVDLLELDLAASRGEVA